jgi:CheY-like chemotaxis protein
MGPKKSLLLVDSDVRSMRVLEVSLKKAGFSVRTAATAQEALNLAQEEPPDLLVTESNLPDFDGFDLSLRLHADPKTAQVAVVFLSEASSPETRIRAINAGADDFLPKPVLVKEVVARLRGILEKRQTESIARRERPGNLSGTLANMGVVDLLQVMEAGKKSGIVHLSSDPVKSGGFVAEGQARGTMFFRDGRVIDAKLGPLTGLDAVYRMLLWEDGVFEIEFKPVSREDLVRTTTQTVLLEGMRRVDEWSRFAEALPPLASRLAVDFAALGKSVVEVPATTRPILHLFDGRRTLFEVVNDSQIEDAVALEIIAKLHDAGVLYLANRGTTPPASSDQAVEAWLSASPRTASTITRAMSPRENDVDTDDLDLPSALGRAVIPSPASASEILQAADPRPEPTALPEPLNEPSLILSRHTVPANRAVPLTQAPTPAPMAEPIPLTQATHAPRLAIQRMSSVVAAPARPASVVEPAPVAPAAARPAPVEEEDGWDDVKTTPSFAPPTSRSISTPIVVRDELAGMSDVSGLQSLRRPEPRIEVKLEPRNELKSAPSIPPSQVDVADTRPPAPTAPVAKARNSSYVIAPAGAPSWPATPPAALEPSPVSEPPRESPVPSAIPHEVSNVSKNFFDNPDDVGWELEGSAWKRRLPGIALVAAAVISILVLATGRKEKTELPIEPPAKTRPAKAAWPSSPEGAVIIQEGAAPEGAPTPSGAPSPTGSPPPAGTPAPATATPTPSPEVAAPAGQPGAPIEAPKPIEPIKAAPVAEAPKPVEPAKAPVAPPPVAAAPAPTKAIETPAPPAGDPNKAAALVTQGDDALRAEKFLEARKRYADAIQADANSAAAHSGIAMAYVELGKDGAAKSEARTAIKLDPGQARAHLALAIVAYNAGDTAGAKKAYTAFLKHEPTGKRADEVRLVLKSLP